MYEYRLTKLGKIVVTSFIIVLLSVTGILSKGIIARAQNNLVDKPSLSRASKAQGLVDSDFLGEKSVVVHALKGIGMENQSIETSFDLGGAYKVMGTSYLSIDNGKDELLSVEVEQAYVYEGKKIAFLTFDDGPSKNVTPQLLDILNKYNVKATFFVVGSNAQKNSTVLKDLANRGHAIGIHTYSHDYKKIYKSTDNFINEIHTTENVLKQTLGEEYHTRLFRFPGGSFEGFKTKFKNILEKGGYVSVDWNAITGDAEAKVLPAQKLLDRLKATSLGKNRLVVLMHDSTGKQSTVDALPGIIEYLKSEGYEFGVLK